jgi:hypothetical protein
MLVIVNNPQPAEVTALHDLIAGLTGTATPADPAVAAGIALILTRIQTMSGQLDALTAKIDALQAQVVVLTADLADEKARDDIHAGALASVAAELEALKNMAVPLPVDTTALEAKIASIGAMITDADTAVKALDATAAATPPAPPTDVPPATEAPPPAPDVTP